MAQHRRPHPQHAGRDGRQQDDSDRGADGAELLREQTAEAVSDDDRGPAESVVGVQRDAKAVVDPGICQDGVVARPASGQRRRVDVVSVRPQNLDPRLQ